MKVFNIFSVTGFGILVVIYLLINDTPPLKVISPIADEEPVWVKYCELINNPSKYDKRLIATEALLVVNTASVVDGGEPFLYAPKCDSSEHSYTVIDIFNTYTISDSEVSDFEKKLVKEAIANQKIARMRVIIIGHFYGNKTKRGYGHLDWAGFKLTVKDKARIDTVSPEVPLPKAWNKN